MSRRDPHVNLLRTTTAALCRRRRRGRCGDRLAVHRRAGAAGRLCPPAGARLQVILQEESGIGRVADAAAGAGFVEAATGELAAAAWARSRPSRRKGGMLAGLASGFVQGRIAEAARRAGRPSPNGAFGLTGVSQFPKLDEVAIDVLDVPLPQDWRGGPSRSAIACTPLAQERLAQPSRAARCRRCRIQAHRTAPGGVSRQSRGEGGVRRARPLGPQPVCRRRDCRAAEAASTAPRRRQRHSGRAARRWRACAGRTGLWRDGRRRGRGAARGRRGAGLRGRRPGVLEGAGVDEFLYDGIDVVAALERLHEALKVGG
jgi:methylmalonyl-CoA mutase